ncbi:glycine zipper domain-containing protein [Arhodomonas aquaeolei]|uniref:glycine zipper domain-containing protein n=1 Tax=Arhodomonas aquaeolei TaxID=2369 RepID=UPI00036A7202|nr:glycine zipper domain-containing protein [Arhodomonas aquaeolei]
MKGRYALALGALVATAPALADDTTDAAIGGAIGGATGAAIGSEVGGRDGAIVGGAVGAATGAAVTTDGDGGHDHRERERVIHEGGGPSGDFCPPGQARKGRC